MQTPLDLESIVRYYNRLLDKNESDAKSVGWVSEASQARKFTEVTGIFAKTTEPFTVLDVGCGLANLAAFLRANHPLATYRGCDINPHMIARARRSNPQIDVECCDLRALHTLESSDYVVASGTFNLRATNSTHTWSAYVKENLELFFRIAKRGIAVGFLSSFGDDQAPDEYYPNPAEILDFAQHHLSRLAEIRHSFSPGHFALHVLKEQT